MHRSQPNNPIAAKRESAGFHLRGLLVRCGSPRPLHSSGKSPYTHHPSEDYMGAIIRAACPCGYTSAEIFEGSGRNPKGGMRALATCDKCHELVSVAVPNADPRCPTCRDPVRPDVGPNAVTLSCPWRGATPLNIEMCGVWD